MWCCPSLADHGLSLFCNPGDKPLFRLSLGFSIFLPHDESPGAILISWGSDSQARCGSLLFVSYQIP